MLYDDDKPPRWRDIDNRDAFAVDLVVRAADTVMPFPEVPVRREDVLEYVEDLREHFSHGIPLSKLKKSWDLWYVARATQGDVQSLPPRFRFDPSDPRRAGMLAIQDLPTHIANQARVVYAIVEVCNGLLRRLQGKHAAAEATMNASSMHVSVILGEDTVDDLHLRWRLHDCLGRRGRLSTFPEQLLEAFRAAWSIGQGKFACDMARGYVKGR